MASNNSTPPAPSGVHTAAALDLKFLADLATRAESLTQVSITTTGLGDGLPSAVPAYWDHRNARLVGVKDVVDAWRQKPQRKQGTAKATTLESFIALVNRHSESNSTVFADTDWRKPSFTAVIDYHHGVVSDKGTGEIADVSHAPEWGKHRVLYEFPLSDEWKAWMGQNGEGMNQADFAAWIEDHIGELSAPYDKEAIDYERMFGTRVATPAELITLSRGLQVHVESSVKNAVTLQSGEGQIQWEETHRDAGGQVLKVPGLFMLSISPFFMGDLVRAPVRLRYRARGGSGITWFFQVYRPDQFVTERVRLDLDRVGRDTGLPTFEGSPEMPSALSPS